MMQAPLSFNVLEQNIDSGCYLIEASAGTGKTYNIQYLYLRLILERHLKTDQILVVTYTEAATAELRDRIRGVLRTALDYISNFDGESVSDADPMLTAVFQNAFSFGDVKTLKKRLLSAVISFDEAAIYTIHGFCRRMLSDNAFESGFGFDIEFVQNQQDLIAEVVRDFWRKKIFAMNADEEEAVNNKSLTLSALTAFAKTIIENPDMAVSSVPDAETVAVRWKKELTALLRSPENPVGQRKIQNQQYGFSDMITGLRDAVYAHGGASSPLAAAIRRQFPVALVDEFQDTDPVQYDIFNVVFNHEGSLFFMIGDPKQSIYAFRGADVYAYLQAKDNACETRTLTQNFRSAPHLLAAFEAVFSRPEPFAEAEILYPHVTSGKGDAFPQKLWIKGVEVEKPMVLHWLTSDSEKSLSKERATRKIIHLLCQEILSLLTHGEISDGDSRRRVSPADIAVLTSLNSEADMIRQSLKRLGIPGVTARTGNVFKSPVAHELWFFMSAVCEPESVRHVKTALFTPMFGFSPAWLAGADDDAGDDRLMMWIECFRQLKRDWVRQGFMAAFSRFIHRHDGFPDGICLLERIAADPLTAERHLADLRQIMQLIHQTARDSFLPPERLTAWLREQIESAENGETSNEAYEMRLDTDRDAVMIMTSHSSKGLEFPIVFAPFLWTYEMVNLKENFTYHHIENGVSVQYYALSGDESQKSEAAREILSEKLRLIYVSLTRAALYCAFWYGNIGKGKYPTGRSALNYLLKPSPDGSFYKVQNFEKEKIMLSNNPVVPPEIDLQKSGMDSLSSLGQARYVMSADISERRIQTLPDSLTSVPAYWGLMSYTSLGRTDQRDLCAWTFEAKTENDIAGESGTEWNEMRSAFADFARGKLVGLCIHEIFESIDFKHVSASGIAHEGTLRRIGAVLERYGFMNGGKSAENFEKTQDMLCRTLSHPLCMNKLDMGGGFALNESDVSYVTEMNFNFPVRGALDYALLNQLTGLNADEAKVILHQGFVTGSIDLVVRHGGRFSFIDWKTDTVGDGSLQAYSQRNLESVMIRNHYLLQYYLYAFALHLHLKSRLSDYHFEQHFGGGFYLFVRGIGDAESSTGIFQKRVTRDDLKILCRIFNFQEAEL